MAEVAVARRDQGVGPILRRWRAARGSSQLDLAMMAGISQRHVSFIESGRSLPSRSTLLALANALDIPFRERNTLLLAAGFAPIYAVGEWDEAEMSGVNAAVDRMLRQQEPYPALVLDRHWNVIRTNRIAPRLFSRLIDLEAVPRPRNMLRLLFDPAQLRPFIAEWDQFAKAMIGRVHREATGHAIDEGAQRLLRDLLAFPGVEPAWQHPDQASSLPMVPLSLIHHGEVIRYFSMVCTIGTPQTVLTQEVRLECMFPADDVSEERHHALIAADLA